MPLDLSGFVTPEQKFEGIYKAAEQLKENRLLAQKQEQLKVEAAKEEQARITAGYTYLQDAFDKKKYATGNVLDDEYVNHKLDEGYSKLQIALLFNKSIGVNELRTIGKGIADNVWNQKTKLQQVNQIAEEAKKNNLNKPGVDSEAIYSNIRNYYLKDDKGLPKTDFSDLKVNPDDLPNIIMQGNVYNHASFDNFVQKSGAQPRTTSFTDKVGKRTVSKTLRTNAPTSFQLEKEGNEIIAVPKYEIATDNDVPVMHTVINDGMTQDKEIRMVDEDVFNQFTPEMKSFLDQETKKFASQLGETPTPTQIHQFQKALAYYELKNSSKLNTKVENIVSDKTNVTVNVPSESKITKQQTKDDLYNSLDTEKPDADGNLDVSGYINSVQVGNIKVRQGEDALKVKYNPSTKQVTVIDSDGNSNVMPFSKFISTVRTNNTKDDIDQIRMIGGYKGKGSAAPASAASPTKSTQAANTITGKNLVKKKKLWE